MQKDALLEEYSSALQSGFELSFKQYARGRHSHIPRVKGNDIRMTNVPDIRVEFRRKTLQSELQFVETKSRAAVVKEKDADA